MAYTDIQLKQNLAKVLPLWVDSNGKMSQKIGGNGIGAEIPDSHLFYLCFLLEEEYFKGDKTYKIGEEIMPSLRYQMELTRITGKSVPLHATWQERLTALTNLLSLWMME